MSATRRRFGKTWWGQAWIEALEARAVHDPNRLPRGRTYARKGSAEDLSIDSGHVRAVIKGSSGESYDVLLQIRLFRPDEWEWVLDAIAAKAAHAAALLEGELDPGIIADARQAEVEILPRSGELRTACTCPDWAEPCKHAAAVCYLIADAIDEDPFVIFRLRGMDRSGVLDAIRARRADAAATGPAGPPPLPEPGVLAREAWLREPSSLPGAPTPSARPGRPAPWPSDPSSRAPFDGPGLRRLIVDATHRAWELRAGAASSGLELYEAADLARRAAPVSDTDRSLLASRAGLSEALLEAQAAAWEVAGEAGIRMLEEPPWVPPMEVMEATKSALEAAGVGDGVFQVRSNRITVSPDEQYRFGQDGRWYLFEKLSGRWMLASSGQAEIDDLLDDLS